MKKILFYFSLLIFTAACEETNPTKDPNVPDLPETTQIDDVCEAMDDMEFIAYCYENFDVNGDGKVSMDEAKNVRLIDIYEKNIYSIKGINYFSNLNEIKAYRCPLIEVDLRLNTNLTEISFHICSKLEKVLLPDGISEISNSAFWGCSRLTSIDIPNSVTSIGDRAFLECSGLTSIDLPNAIASIGDHTFERCENLTSIDIPDSVTSIGSNAFFLCGLTSVVIPDQVSEIGFACFQSCFNLEEVTIGKSVTKIEHSTFSYSNNIIRIYCKATKRPECHKTAFDTLPSDLTIYVPRGSAEEYEGWLGCNNIVEYDF